MFCTCIEYDELESSLASSLLQWSSSVSGFLPVSLTLNQHHPGFHQILVWCLMHQLIIIIIIEKSHPYKGKGFSINSQQNKSFPSTLSTMYLWWQCWKEDKKGLHWARRGSSSILEARKATIASVNSGPVRVMSTFGTLSIQQQKRLAFDFNW